MLASEWNERKPLLFQITYNTLIIISLKIFFTLPSRYPSNPQKHYK